MSSKPVLNTRLLSKLGDRTNYDPQAYSGKHCALGEAQESDTSPDANGSPRKEILSQTGHQPTTKRPNVASILNTPTDRPLSEGAGRISRIRSAEG
jgi:hypothetical protein